MENQITPEMLIKEILWENHQIDEGVLKYKDTMLKKDLPDHTGGQKLIKSLIPNTVSAIENAFAVVEGEVMNTVKGPKDAWVYIITLLSAEQTAVITLNKMFSHCQYVNDTASRATTLAKQIGEAMNQQVKFENWKVSEKAILDEYNSTCDEADTKKKSKAQYLIEQAKGQIDRKKLARWEKKFDTYRSIYWGDDTINIGMKLIDIVAQANPEIFNYSVVTRKGKTERLVEMTDAAWLEYEITEDFAELQRPFLLPTLIPPKPFELVNGKIEGGYHHINSPLFSRGINAHTSGDSQAPSQDFLEAINAVQNTAWKINPFILMVVDMIHGTGGEMEDVSQPCTLVTPNMNKDSYDKMTKNEKADYHVERNRIVKDIASARGKHSAFTRKLSIAHKLAEHPRLYFPHFSDFRGRLYPMPSELTPQGNQLAKALLMFADGEKLGKTGLRWLMIHCANEFGLDKETLKDRHSWVEKNLPMLREISSNPLTNKDWRKAEKPFTFLAAAKEIILAIDSGSPENFVSRIPVALDGTCNGMQILSMLGKDEVGAKATNCTDCEERFDLYLTVARAVQKLIARDKADSAIAGEWMVKMKDVVKARKVVKRAVMTIPYGVTNKGIANQLIEDGFCFDMSNTLEASQYMTDAILEAMTHVNGKAVEIMQYFQGVAHTLAKEGKEITWVTPIGLKVTQAYLKTQKKKIKTILGEVILQVEDSKKGIDTADQKRSIAPNVIHSFDAAMLQLTVLKMSRDGYKDFAMIHDSYGVHPSNAESLNKALREAAKDLFKVDRLKEFHSHVQGLTEVVLCSPPEQGRYDIDDITRAVYFFS